MKAFLSQNPDVLQWDTEDVIKWLRIAIPAVFDVSPDFETHAHQFGLDGNLVLQMKGEDEDLITSHLRI